VIRKPFNNPEIHPTKIDKIIETTKFICRLTIKKLQVIDEIPTTALVERSIPPVSITIVIPNAMIPVIEVCLNKLKILPVVKKVGDFIEKNINKMINMAATPYFWKISFA
jgi:hypothetical protein